MNNPTATIAAISTPPGKGGVALIRLSGPDAFVIADRVFSPRYGKTSLSARPPRVQVYGDISDRGEHIDDGLATRFPAPASYTGEDTVEFTCHGGVLVTRCVLEALLRQGAEAATGGEFTRRAFLNGRLTLTEAEAIGDLLEAKSYTGMRLAGAEARDRLTKALGEIHHEMITLMSSVFARIDYPDEDLGEFTDEETKNQLITIRGQIDRLMGTYRTGRAIKEGIPTIILGKPNVGKSSLYNLLVGDDSAIVTDIAGTTRDILERAVPLGRVLLHLADTAGVRECTDAVEKIGVERARERLQASELVFAVFDGASDLDADDFSLIDELSSVNAIKIAIINKSDLPTKIDISFLKQYFEHTIHLSAKTGDFYQLSALVERLCTDTELSVGNDAVISSARQYGALSLARDAVDASIKAYELGFYTDAAASDLEQAIGYISELYGKRASEEVVNDIFSRFCVGK